MKLVTWNVNSLRARLKRVVAWLERHAPDVVCLQETKCPDDLFPARDLEVAGYRATFTGQKGLNGVAILTRIETTAAPVDVVTALPGTPRDPQRRFVEVVLPGEGGAEGLRVLCVYVPNGQAVGSDAYFYKLDWLSRLLAHLRTSHDPARPLVLCGDFNVAPTDLDVPSPEAYRDRLFATTPERRALGHLEAWGLVDALRARSPTGPGPFTWFDYAPGAVERDDGLRIDLIYATPPLVERLVEVTVDLDERRGDRPSDHAPVVAAFRP